jgi:hypothetical protein
MNLSEETIQRAVIETLLERLPNCLAEESQEPIRYLHRDNFGPMSWRDELIQLPPLAELWAEQHIALNYPALLVHYRETTETEIAECDEKDVALLFQLDLILTYHEPEALQFLWLRYANAVKRQHQFSRSSTNAGSANHGVWPARKHLSTKRTH